VLAAYDLEGRKLGDFAGHSGDVLALAPSPDGRYLVSGASDQTVRLWNLRTYELLVTLFNAADGEWAIWTPQGYYAASPDGGKLFGWQIDRGPERNADCVAAERLRTRFYRPDIVARAIIVGSAKEARGARCRQRSQSGGIVQRFTARPMKLRDIWRRSQTARCPQTRVLQCQSAVSPSRLLPLYPQQRTRVSG
jgi:WD40 repeat protein